MFDAKYTPGGDAQAISNIARVHFGGSYKKMFEVHGWVLETGQQYLHQASSRIKQNFGSIREFENYYRNVEQFRVGVWPDDISVLFTSFWDWTPETWGTIGWSGARGYTRRANLLQQLSDPFICVVYVTNNRSETDFDLKGRICGFYLVSHETGDRYEFTHHSHHNREATRWRHSLRAIRAFSYLPEFRPKAMEVFPKLKGTARHIAAMGSIISDEEKIEELRNTPWIEVPVFSSRNFGAKVFDPDHPMEGIVPAGPARSRGYKVPTGNLHLPRELYILRMQGNTEAYLGRSAVGKSIFKIGMSVSPDLRRQYFQKVMPRGAFKWVIAKTTRRDGQIPYSGYRVAVAGENAMKEHLAANSEWLGGEFYLASKAVIESAWKLGREAAMEIYQQGQSNDDC